MTEQTSSLVTPQEAADIIGRSLQTIRKWIAEKRLIGRKKLGRIYFERALIEQLAQAADVPPSRKKQKKGK